MRKLFLLPLLLLGFSGLLAQTVEFTYQSGLASPIKIIRSVPGSSTCIVATQNGQFIAWDVTLNKILFKIETRHTALSDILFIPETKWLLVAGDKGIEVYEASKLLTEQAVTLLFTYTRTEIAALSWNDVKKTLRVIDNDGSLLSFNPISTLQTGEPSQTFKTGVRYAFGLRETSDKLLVAGLRQQACFDPGKGTLLSQSSFTCNGSTGHVFSDKEDVLYAPSNNSLLKIKYTRSQITAETVLIKALPDEALMLGMAADTAGNVFIGTNHDRIFRYNSYEKTIAELYKQENSSFTSLFLYENFLMAGDFFGNAIVLDPDAGEKIVQLNEDATPALNGIYLHKNKMVSTHFGVRGVAIKIWDIPSASLEQSFNIKGNVAYHVYISPQGDSIISFHTDDAVYLCHRQGDTYKIDTLEPPSMEFMYGSFFIDITKDKKSQRQKDAKNFQAIFTTPGLSSFIAGREGSAEVTFVKSLEECNSNKLTDNYRIPIACLLAAGLQEETKQWDIMDSDLFYMRACSSDSLEQFLERTKSGGIPKDKATLFYNIVKGKEKTAPFFYISDLNTQQIIKSFSFKEVPAYVDATELPEAATIFLEDSLIVWNRKANTSTTIPFKTDAMGFYYDYNDEYIAIAEDKNNTISVYNIKNRVAEASRWISFGEEEYLVYFPEGYFKTTSRSKRINLSINKQPLSFSSFDFQFNRPDLVIEKIGAADSALIKAYRTAWQKRIQKSGFQKTGSDGGILPEAVIANRSGIEYTQLSETLSLALKFTGGNTGIADINIWVNEAPVYGSNGLNLRSLNRKTLDTTLSVTLSAGQNRIEVSVTNSNGIGNYRVPLTVRYTPRQPVDEKIYFIGIGIDQFADSRYNLQYSVKDIRDLAVKLEQKYGSAITIDTLFNENVTIGNTKALKQRLQQASVNDKVIISFSGHGLLSKDYDYYLSTYNINFDNPEQNGLPYDELENLLDNIPARKKLMLIDACHSGEVDKDELVRIDSISKINEIKGLKPVAYKKEGHLGMKNSFELMQSLFVNVGKSTGATIISAAAGTQFALERNDLKNGVFTYSILEVMNKYPNIKISELKKIVGERVEQLTKGLQKPTSRNETIAVDWEL